MPFLTYQVTPSEAVRNAGRLLKDAGAAAVKVEGGRSVIDVVRRLVDVGIPVMGHLGVLPQSVNQQSGYRQRGRDAREAELIFNDALALQDAGAFAVVLEAIPSELAARITAALDVPTVGIGAGPDCDGQVLVSSDLLGPARQDSAVREAIRQPRRDHRRCRARVRRGRAGDRTSDRRSSAAGELGRAQAVAPAEAECSN